MNALHAVGNEVNDLLGGIGDTCLLHGSRVVPKLVHHPLEPGGQVSAGQLTASLDLFFVRHRRYAWWGMDRNMPWCVKPCNVTGFWLIVLSSRIPTSKPVI